ncbi:MAG: ABC transporter permease [Actinomycetota bacterium]|nr:ABC transporter permease [Actinomycetota bacterium]
MALQVRGCGFMLTDLYRHRALIGAFANRDFATRYRSSILGWAWSLIQPLAILVVFAAVFSLVFRIQAPDLGNGEGSSYAAFLFTGLVTWNLFAGLLNLSMTQLKSNGELLKKVQFPAWAPVLGASIVQLIQVLLELAVLVVMFLWLRNVGWTWILAIPILIGTALFAQGIGLVLSIVNARFGDVMYIVAVVLSALYFLTPVLYPISMVEGQNELLSLVVKLNPMSWYVESMHEVMYALVAPPALVIVALLVGGFLTFWAGLAIFNRGSEDIGELL